MISGEIRTQVPGTSTDQYDIFTVFPAGAAPPPPVDTYYRILDDGTVRVLDDGTIRVIV